MFDSCAHMLQAGHRKLSRHIAEDDEEMIKMKEYMEQKGLWFVMKGAVTGWQDVKIDIK